jgi:hypothetical protein
LEEEAMAELGAAEEKMQLTGEGQGDDEGMETEQEEEEEEEDHKEEDEEKGSVTDVEEDLEPTVEEPSGSGAETTEDGEQVERRGVAKPLASCS